MLTDAEMAALLKERKKFVESLLYVFVDDLPEEKAYLLALDAALPKLVEEIRRLRWEWVQSDAPAGMEFENDAQAWAYYEREYCEF